MKIDFNNINIKKQLIFITLKNKINREGFHYESE